MKNIGVEWLLPAVATSQHPIDHRAVAQMVLMNAQMTCLSRR